MFSMIGRTGAHKKGPHKRKMSDNLNNFVALNSSYSTPSVLLCYASPEQNVDDDNTVTVRVV